MTKTRLIVLLIAAVGSYVAYRWNDWRVEREMRAVRAALRDFDVESALPLAERVVRLAPENGESHMLLARVQRRLGRLSEVRRSLDQAAQLGIRQDRIDREEQMALAQVGQLEAALPHLPKLLADPRQDGPDICEAFANGFFLAYRFGEAFQILDAWEKDYPTDPQPYLFRGLYAVQSEGLKEAAEQYGKAFQLAPQRWEIRLHYAESLMNLHRANDAVEVLRTMPATRTLEKKVQLTWGRALTEIGDFEEAEIVLRQVLETNSDDPDALLAVSRLELDANRPSAALPLLEKAIALRGYDSGIRFAHGNALRLLGRQEEANGEFAFVAKATKAVEQRQRLKERLAVNFSDIEARYEMADLALEFSPQADRLFWLRSIVELDPSQKHAHQLLSVVYAERGELEEANRHRKIAAKLPESEPSD